MTCPKCLEDMKEVTSRNADGKGFRCSKRSCRLVKRIRDGSFFEKITPAIRETNAVYASLVKGLWSRFDRERL